MALIAFKLARSVEHGVENMFQTLEVGSQMSDLWEKGDGLISDCE